MSAPTAGVLREAWGLYREHPRHLLGVAFVVYVAVAAVTAGVAVVLPSALAALIAFIATFLGYFWVQGALVNAVADIRDGRADLSVRETLERGWTRLGPVATASSLAVAAIVLGLLFFVVPGLVLMTWWVLIIPVIVLEHAGARRAFGRSRALVRGDGWRVFGVIALTILILVVAGAVLDLVFAPLAGWARALLSDVVTGTVTAPFAALAWTLLYYRLREARAVPAAHVP